MPAILPHDPGACFAPSGSITGQPWQVVYTKPNGERTAELELRRQAFVVWLPSVLTRQANRQRIIRPLFPRYLLVQLDLVARAWGPVNGTRGVDRLLTGVDGRPHCATWITIAALMAHCAPDGVVYPPEPREMRRGDHGTPTVGPWRDFAGVCDMTTRERVRLLLSVFGRATPVWYARQDVELTV